MSMITENTVVCRPDAVGRVMADLETSDESRNYKKLWHKDKFAVIIFDCNGDSPWDIQGTANTQADWEDILALETNYGDSDGYWTQILVEENFDGELLDWLHDQLTEQEYNEVKELIQYTI